MSKLKITYDEDKGTITIHHNGSPIKIGNEKNETTESFSISPEDGSIELHFPTKKIKNEFMDKMKEIFQKENGNDEAEVSLSLEHIFLTKKSMSRNDNELSLKFNPAIFRKDMPLDMNSDQGTKRYLEEKHKQYVNQKEIILERGQATNDKIDIGTYVAITGKGLVITDISDGGGEVSQKIHSLRAKKAIELEDFSTYANSDQSLKKENEYINFGYEEIYAELKNNHRNSDAIYKFAAAVAPKNTEFFKKKLCLLLDKEYPNPPAGYIEKKMQREIEFANKASKTAIALENTKDLALKIVRKIDSNAFHKKSNPKLKVTVRLRRGAENVARSFRELRGRGWRS